MKYALGDTRVQTHGDDYWIAPNATVVGNVKLEKDVSIWWNAVLRGDNELMTIGEGSNIQDGSVCHSDPGSPLTVGRHVTIGHMVMLHGCTIGDHSLVGIGSVVLNRARIGRYCVIGAKALITEGKEIPDYSMVLGAPAKVVKTLTHEEAEQYLRGAANYVRNYKRFKADLRRQD